MGAIAERAGPRRGGVARSGARKQEPWASPRGLARRERATGALAGVARRASDKAAVTFQRRYTHAFMLPVEAGGVFRSGGHTALSL